MNEEPPTSGQAVGLRLRHAIQTGHRPLKNHAHPSGQRQLATSEQDKQHTPGHHANLPPCGPLTPPVYLVQTLPETYPAWEEHHRGVQACHREQGARCLPSAAKSLLQEQIPASPPSPARQLLFLHPAARRYLPYRKNPDYTELEHTPVAPPFHTKRRPNRHPATLLYPYNSSYPNYFAPGHLPVAPLSPAMPILSLYPAALLCPPDRRHPEHFEPQQVPASPPFHTMKKPACNQA